MMEPKFIFDREMKEREDIISDILEAVRKKPYPSKETTILATFLHTVFQINHQKNSSRYKPSAIHAPEQEELERQMPKIEKKPLPVPPKVHLMKRPPEEAHENALTPFPGGNVHEEILLPPAPMQEKMPAQAEKLPAAEMPIAETAIKKIAPKDAAKTMQNNYIITTFNTPVPASIETINGKPVYNIREPEINNDVLSHAKEYIKDDFEKDFKILDKQDYINKKIEKACKKAKVKSTPEIILNTVYYLKRDLLGFRKIDPMMYDNNVLEIFCDGLNKPLMVEIRGKGKISTNVIFTESKDLNILLGRLAKATGNVLSEEKPILDSTFQGYKVQAILGMGGASSKLILKKETV